MLRYQTTQFLAGFRSVFDSGERLPPQFVSFAKINWGTPNLSLRRWDEVG
jgi:hypothetical protein